MAVRLPGGQGRPGKVRLHRLDGAAYLPDQAGGDANASDRHIPGQQGPVPHGLADFFRLKVTVRSACTARPRTRPVSASTPLAMSAATTAPLQELMRSMAAANLESGAISRERPTPNTASSTTWQPRAQEAWALSWGSKTSSSTPHSLSLPVSSMAPGVRRS